MNANLEALYQIGKKATRTIIGLMSGTSLDGLDIALCEVSESGEQTKVRLIAFETLAYNDGIKNEIRAVFAKKTIDFQQLVLLNEWIGITHAAMINQCLENWNIKTDAVDLIASHGQTVFHAPKIQHQLEAFPNGTLQIGDGDHIAVHTGIITLSDFRQKHVAAGGEGAPLAVYGDYFLFSNKEENRIMLNIGGIANFTYLPASQNPKAVFVTDTGTGNTLMDAFTRLHFPGKAYDKDAEIATQGTVNQNLLKALKQHSFFKSDFPKTTGPELFNLEYVKMAQKQSNTENCNPTDLLATLTRFTAETVAEAIKTTAATTAGVSDNLSIYVSGGGAHNPLLIRWLQELLPYKFANTTVLGISADAKEAILFAILANETVAGGQSNFGTQKGIPSVCMGKISFPN